MNFVNDSKRTIWTARILLLILGCLFTWGFWEGVLGSATFQYLVRPMPVLLSTQDRSAYRILALGESTTAKLSGRAWPEFLQEALDLRVGVGKFRVINLGISGANSRVISTRLPAYVAYYQPQMVITMMGINDVGDESMTERFLNRSRVYRFLSILWHTYFSSVPVRTATGVHYQELALYLSQHHIRHIVMQYPMLPIAPLQKLLSHVKDIVYVSNEENFKQALQSRAYDALFIDHFTGAFGHTTALGSQMIATNLIEAVLQGSAYK